MLKRLHIKNVALIAEADIQFGEKLNVLSGETGSGKSVILDSINFVLGSKADKSMIRFGEQEAMVRAEFVVDENSDAVKVLSDYDIESDGTIVITRKFNVDGRGSVKINGDAATSSMLKTLTARLVDVHGQSEHFFLLNEENQLKLVDTICGDRLSPLKVELSELVSEKRRIKRTITELGGDEGERARRLDLLKFQIEEIEAADLKIGEFEQLKSRRNILMNIEKIFAALNAVHSIFSDDGGCIDSISEAKRNIHLISDLDSAYSDISDRLEEVGAEIEDISETVSDAAEGLTFDEEEAKFVDERISLINNLKKKYGADEQEILKFCDDAQEKFDALSDAAATIDKLTAELSEIDDKIYSVCRKITDLRQKSAQNFCQGVIAELKTLNIANADFAVNFKEYDKGSADLNSVDGSDKIEFLFSANKGEPLKPLSKVISGGEMSRFMLAVKTNLKDLNGISTYIFDEIDAGISGFTANTVAEKFKYIAERTQIIAVSHLPQVCAASDTQLLIYKVDEGGKTLTKIKQLTEEEKVDEIVRLTGNIKSEAATDHARQLIKNFKK